MRLVQLTHPEEGRKIAVVEEPNLVLLQSFHSIYELAGLAIQSEDTFTELVRQHRTRETLAYDPVYEGASIWKLLPAFDHPGDPLHCMLSGTGLTHKASAENRQKMHEAQKEAELTDSMKMYLWGVEGGHPPAGQVGVQPEWFYKGNGTMLRAHGQTLLVPPYGNDGGEEPEVAGIYLNDRNGKPWRIGFATGNEFSDHVMERKNYLYLAPSKIRTCSIGPELVIDADFDHIRGRVSIERNGKTFWEKKVRTGEKNMSHSLANLEYHHFKYDNHRVPGQVHIHFFGADAFSFGEQIKLEAGDVMAVHWEGMGRPLLNPLTVRETEEERFFAIDAMR